MGWGWGGVGLGLVPVSTDGPISVYVILYYIREIQHAGDSIFRMPFVFSPTMMIVLMIMTVITSLKFFTIHILTYTMFF